MVPSLAIMMHQGPWKIKTGDTGLESNSASYHRRIIAAGLEDSKMLDMLLVEEGGNGSRELWIGITKRTHSRTSLESIDSAIVDEPA